MSSDTMRASSLRPRLLAGVVAACVVAGAIVAGPAAADDDAANGIPASAPPAAFFDEPELPEPTLWPLSERFSRTSGTARYDDGALLWTDWLYDDTGDGSFDYASEDAAANGADVFRAGVGIHRNRSYWRIDWNTLVDPDLPIAVWALDTDNDPRTGATEWPAQAGVSSPGADAFLVVSSRGAWLVDGDTGKRQDLVARGAEVAVDERARSFVVSVPRSALRVNGTWTVRLATGIADASGEAFAAPPGDSTSRVYNVAFRTHDQENARGDGAQKATGWNNGAQSDALSRGDLTPFALELDWRDLARGTTTPEPNPSGFSTRWYVSSVELAQGLDPDAREPRGQPPTADPRVYGRVQPYTIYVPESYEAGEPAPLTILLHGGGGNHNGFRGSQEEVLHDAVCEQRGSICVAPLGRGDSTWYVNEAELDVWEVWNRVAETYTIDGDRTAVAGWSMGGVGATRLAVNHPDVFAAVGVVSGAGYRNAVAGNDRTDDILRVENLASTTVFLDAGTDDLAEQNTRDWEAAFADAGVPYLAHYYEGATHGHFGTVGWPEFADRVDEAERRASPAEVAFRWDPREERADLGLTIDSAYWVEQLDPRNADAPLSRIAARSGALDTVETRPVVSARSAEYAGRDTEIRELLREPVAERAPTDELDLELTNVAAATIDLERAGLGDARTVELRVDADGPVALTLRGTLGETTVEVGSGTHRIRL